MALCGDDTFVYTSIAVNTSNIRRGTAIDWLVFAMFVMCLKQESVLLHFMMTALNNMITLQLWPMQVTCFF